MSLTEPKLHQKPLLQTKQNKTKNILLSGVRADSDGLLKMCLLVNMTGIMPELRNTPYYNPFKSIIID